MGGAYLTPLSTDNVGFRDRFTFPDCTVKFSEVFSKNSTNKLRYPVIQMIALRSVEKFLYEGVDFDVDTDLHTNTSTIIWKTMADPPADGELISTLYTTFPVYICLNPIHELRGTYSMEKGGGTEYFVPLPKQFKIKRESFIDNTDVPAF
jgi:hypothetical protein